MADNADKTDDIPRTRWAIEQTATKFKICFILALALIGSLLFIGGVVTAWKSGTRDLPEGISEPLVLIILGMIDFALFFPLFLALYFGRHFMVSIRRLERENQELRQKVEAIQRTWKPEPQ